MKDHYPSRGSDISQSCCCRSPVATGNVCIVLDCLATWWGARSRLVWCCRLIRSSNNQLLDDGQWCHRDQNHTSVAYLSEDTISHLFTYSNNFVCTTHPSAYLYRSHPIVCGIRRHFHPGWALLYRWVCGSFCPRQGLVCPKITWTAQWRTESRLI